MQVQVQKVASMRDVGGTKSCYNRRKTCKLGRQQSKAFCLSNGKDDKSKVRMCDADGEYGYLSAPLDHEAHHQRNQSAGGGWANVMPIRRLGFGPRQRPSRCKQMHQAPSPCLESHADKSGSYSIYSSRAVRPPVCFSQLYSIILSAPGRIRSSSLAKPLPA